MGKEQYFGKGAKKAPVLLRGKEEKTHEQVGKQRYDASFFKSALKEKEYRGRKY